MALMLVSLGVFATPSAGEEARAATHAGRASNGPAASPDSLLGALSLSSRRDPIAVTADTMEFDYRTRVLTYKGSVVVTQADMKLEANNLTVSLDEHADNRVKEVVADGNVRLSQGARWATGGRAIFDQARNLVVLRDNAELHDGPNEVKGDLVTVYLDEQRSEVKGGKGRVTAKLFPSQIESTPAGGKAP